MALPPVTIILAPPFVAVILYLHLSPFCACIRIPEVPMSSGLLVLGAVFFRPGAKWLFRQLPGGPRHIPQTHLPLHFSHNQSNLGFLALPIPPATPCHSIPFGFTSPKSCLCPPPFCLLKTSPCSLPLPLLCSLPLASFQHQFRVFVLSPFLLLQSRKSTSNEVTSEGESFSSFAAAVAEIWSCTAA